MPNLLLVLLGCLVHGARHAGALTLAQKQGSKAELNANPIRKVIDLLQNMKDRVETESKKEEALFAKYECFCSTGTTNLKNSVAKANLKTPQIKANLEVAKNAQDALEEEFASNKEEREVIVEKIGKIKAMRAKAAAAFAKEAAEKKVTLNGLDAAISRLQGGSPELLQEGAAALRHLAQSQKQLQQVKGAQEMLEAVADENFQAANSPGVDQVVGVCKQLRERIQKEFDAATAEEDSSIAEHHTLMEASEDEKKSLTAAIEAKIVRMGNLKVNIEETQEDLEATASTLDSDVTFGNDVSKTCSTIGETFKRHMASRSQEMITLTSTIEWLNRDESLELFKKAGRSSFLQVAMSSSSHRSKKRVEALRLLQAAKALAVRHHRAGRLDLIMLALRGRGRRGAKKNEFAPVVKTINEMVQVLKKEQKTDYSKREYCLKEKRDTKSALNALVDDKVAKAIANNKDFLETTKQEITEEMESIKRLDLGMEDATYQRAQNHKGYMEVIMTNRAALEILDLAKNKLLQYYNPNLAKGVGVSDGKAAEGEHKLNPNMCGPGCMAVMRGMTGVQTDADEDDEEDDDDPEAPEAGSREQASISVIELLGKLEGEIKRDTTEAEGEETNHKASFQLMRKDALDERRLLARTTLRKQEVKAQLEKKLHKLHGEAAGIKKQTMELDYLLHKLGEECDFLMKNYDNRKVARTNEEEALKRAIQVLVS